MAGQQTKKVVQTEALKAAYGQNTSSYDLRTDGEIANPVTSNFKSVGGHMFRNTKNTDRSKDIMRPEVS